jgi:hypothetical protein
MFIKELTAMGLQCYFLPNCKMIIPTKLWEETHESPAYVFSQLAVADYLKAMRKVQSELRPHDLLLGKTSLFTSSVFTHGPRYALKVIALS